MELQDVQAPRIGAGKLGGMGVREFPRPLPLTTKKCENDVKQKQEVVKRWYSSGRGGSSGVMFWLLLLLPKSSTWRYQELPP